MLINKKEIAVFRGVLAGATSTPSRTKRATAQTALAALVGNAEAAVDLHAALTKLIATLALAHYKEECPGCSTCTPLIEAKVLLAKLGEVRP